MQWQPTDGQIADSGTQQQTPTEANRDSITESMTPWKDPMWIHQQWHIKLEV